MEALTADNGLGRSACRAQALILAQGGKVNTEERGLENSRSSLLERIGTREPSPPATTNDCTWLKGFFLLQKKWLKGGLSWSYPIARKSSTGMVPSTLWQFGKLLNKAVDVVPINLC